MAAITNGLRDSTSGTPVILRGSPSVELTDASSPKRFGPDFGASFRRRTFREPLTWASCG
jgi:hypothetical protein